MLAALNHPNIAHIYGLEKQERPLDFAQGRRDGQEGACALVMALVEGQTLADRIAKGAMPIDEELPSAKQIADARESAHG